MSTNGDALADSLYQKAKTYNWRDNPSDAALAYSLFTGAARLGHVQAKSDLAGMMFYGSGGPKEQALAMALTWEVFAPNGIEPLESLVELLGNYADQLSDPFERAQAENATEKAEIAVELLRYVSGCVIQLARQRTVELRRPSK